MGRMRKFTKGKFKKIKLQTMDRIFIDSQRSWHPSAHSSWLVAHSPLFFTCSR